LLWEEPAKLDVDSRTQGRAKAEVNDCDLKKL
jgi:hypothetical protein